VIQAGGRELAVPMEDRTPWRAAPSQIQSLRLWLPYEPNANIAAGTWSRAETLNIERLVDGQRVDVVPLALSVPVAELTDVDISGGSYETDNVLSPRGEDGASSVYYVVADPSMGPTNRVWWDGPADPVRLRAPLMDVDSGEILHLRIKAWKVACDRRWDLNSGQSNWACNNHAHLEVDPEGNDAFRAGRSYRSPPTAPLVLEARRWHAPNANSVLAKHHLRISYRP